MNLIDSIGKNKDELVSIIVPIYNIENYINKCVTSLVNQTYQNLEIILVNDCSTDSSKRKCEQWKALDKRIVLINKEKNEGLSCARNTGLLNAKGEYIAFIDGDDYVSINFIEVLYNAVKKDNTDIASCSFFYVENDIEIEKKKKNEQGNVIYLSVEAFKECIRYPSRIDVVAWNKLYLRSLFIENNIMYPPGKIHEDLFTTYKLVYFSKKVSYVDLPLYYYVQRSDSIMHAPNLEKESVLIECCENYASFLHSHSIDLEEELSDFYQYRLLSFLINVMADNPQIYNKKIWSEAYRIMKGLHNIKKKYFLTIHAMKIPRLYMVIRKVLKRK